MFARCSCIFAFTNNVRQLSTSCKFNAAVKNHYDVLGLTPRATQTEVKAAYYKLSMVYHPDKNKGSEEAVTKFRDITAAYEILGNVKNRRLYDKGVRFDRPTYRHPAEDDDPRTRFYRSREVRHRPPAAGRTPIYDFDEWSRAHYGATFARDMDRKRKAAHMKETQSKDEADSRIEKVVTVFIVIAILLMYFTRDDYDVDRKFYKAEYKTKAP